MGQEFHETCHEAGAFSSLINQYNLRRPRSRELILEAAFAALHCKLKFAKIVKLHGAKKRTRLPAPVSPPFGFDRRIASGAVPASTTAVGADLKWTALRVMTAFWGQADEGSEDAP
jgi:hypothetical protein